MAQTTNKPKQYSLIADTLISYIEKLYFVEEVTQAYFGNFHPALLPEKISNFPILYKAYDPFQLKLNIITSINPLKAKILLFYALNEQFNFSDRGWVELKAQQLDELLQNLFYLCPTFSELKNKLEDSASIMQDLNGMS